MAKKIPLNGFFNGKKLATKYAIHFKWDSEKRVVTSEPDGTYDITVADAGDGLQSIVVRVNEPLTDSVVKQIQDGAAAGRFYEVNFDADAYVIGNVRGVEVYYQGRATRANVTIPITGDK
jgi:hypothetical protein